MTKQEIESLLSELNGLVSESMLETIREAITPTENLWPTWVVEEAFKNIGTDWERQQAIDRLPEILAEGKPEWRGP